MRGRRVRRGIPLGLTFLSVGYLLLACVRVGLQGAFDNTIRLWDLWQLETGTGGTSTAAAWGGEHQLPVSALAWHADSATLVSGSFDQTVRTWDVATARVTSVVAVAGFVSAIALQPTHNAVQFVATTARRIRLLDARAPPDAAIREIATAAPVHSLYCYRNGEYILSADHRGVLQTWDVATGRLVHEVVTDAAMTTPISHIAVCHPRESEEEGRLLAANAWDNVLRVYDRGKLLRHFSADAVVSPAAAGGAGAADEVAKKESSPFTISLLHECRSHRNQAWPIKSSFYMGASYQGKAAYRPAVSFTTADDRSGGGGGPPVGGATFPGGAFGGPAPIVDVSRTVLLASGSADTAAYLYDVGGPADTARLVQRLMGHRDRVYVAQFHPHQPLLATGSADHTIKLWGPKENFFAS